MSDEVRDLVATLRTLHERLAARTVELSPHGLRTRSYATEWTVADVLSHLGSGAELTLLRLDTDPRETDRPDAEDGPSQEEMAAVWARWDAREPEQQAMEGIAAQARLVDRLEELDDAAVQVLRRDLDGLDIDAAGMLRMRVAELAMHSWDIAVAFDDGAVVAPEALPAVLDLLPVTLRFAAQPHDEAFAVDVQTTDPDRALRLDLRPGEARVTGTGTNTSSSALELPAEALARLVYGRLDPGHTPPVKVTDDALLPHLRDIFRGF